VLVRIRFPVLCCFLLLLASVIGCGENSTEPDLIQFNPYGISPVDLGAAREQAIGHRATLGKLTGRYGFTEIDIDYASQQLADARTRRDQLAWMALSGDFRLFGNFFMALEDIRAGIEYWTGERQRIINEAQPYWDGQQDLAVASTDQAWIIFCDRMVNNLLLAINWIDRTIARLEVDETIIANEEVPHLRNTAYDKMAVEEAAIAYWEDLVGVLNQDLAGLALDWGNVENLIASLEGANEGTDYWFAEQDSISMSSLPYWQQELELATEGGVEEWIGLCDHMIASLKWRLDVAQATIADLATDRDFIENEGGESLEELYRRKRLYHAEATPYFEDLFNVLREAASLALIRE